ncbi:MAG: hypothetical protein J6Z03_08575 [Erysipelotrichaceae bacterium]|nr:hypothetical protein [Erysipelotrichaceae bacterium]
MSENKKPTLASAVGYFDNLREKGLLEEKDNKGYVWTMLIDGPTNITVPGLANVVYNLRLNCSHVGETPYGVYRGELDFDFSGDMAGAYSILAMVGFSAQDDMKGWFKNNRFVMELKPYDETSEKEFIETFDTGNDSGKDVGAELLKSFLSGIASSITPNEEQETRIPDGLWYDWSFHMTEGDMGTYLKIGGGVFPYYGGNSYAATDSSGSTLDVDAKATALFARTVAQRYSEPIDSPFPYSIKVYEDKDVLFTLYNSKGGPFTAKWKGQLSKIPVEDTIVVK